MKSNFVSGYRTIVDFLLGAMLLSLVWSLRGQFGHLKGALIPGAAAAFLVVILHKEEIWRRSFGMAVILGSLGFALGGHFGYGRLIEKILVATNLIAVLPEFFHIFLIGALWGGLGMTFLALAVSEKPFLRPDLILLACMGIFWLIPLGPWHNGLYIIFLFGAGLLAIHIYNGLWKHSRIVTLYGAAGFFGFGAAFLTAVLLLHAGHHQRLPGAWPWWALRDQIIGLIGGGVIVAAVRMGQRVHLIPDRSGITSFSEKAGFIFWVGLIPLLNALNVLGYWSIEHAFLTVPEAIFAALLTALVLAAIAVGIARIKSETITGRGLDRIFYLLFIFFVWFLSLAAIFKQTAVFGWSRWEAAFTLFLILSFSLSVFLPFRIFRR